MLRLSELLAKAGIDQPAPGKGDPTIRHITADSRQVQPGSLFIAMPGVHADGAKYIPDAVRASASAVMISADMEVNAPITLVRVDDMRAGCQQACRSVS